VNQMFRRADQAPVQHDDIVSRGYIDWDARVSEALAGQTAWKRCLYAALGIVAISVSGNVWQAGQSHVQVIHVVHDAIGGVIAVSLSSDTPDGPTQAMLAAGLEAWITNVRTVGVDVNAMKRSILSAYDLIEGRSQAAETLKRYYNANEPFHRAETETVALENVVAIPPMEATIGLGGMQTWAVNWTERVTSRDGQNETHTPWSGNITFKLGTPQSLADAKKNPNGVHVIALSWTSK
jgi:type IV secretory pathway TrbF-like protein